MLCLLQKLQNIRTFSIPRELDKIMLQRDPLFSLLPSAVSQSVDRHWVLHEATNCPNLP